MMVPFLKTFFLEIKKSGYGAVGGIE